MKSGNAKIVLSAFLIFLFCPLKASQVEEWQAELDTVRSAERKLELLSLLAQKSPTMDQKIHWAQEWLAFAFEQKDAGAEAHAYYILLTARGNMGDFQTVRQEGKEMLKKALAYGDPELVLNAYNIYAGFGYYSLQSFDSAAILYRRGLDYAETAKDMLSDSIYAQAITRLYVPMVEIYARTGQNEKYLDMAEEFQAIAYSTENNYAIALANFTAGLSQLRLGQKAKAKEILLAGYRYALKSGSETVLSNFYTQLFNAYSDLGKLDSAAYFARVQHEKALELGYENDAYTALYLIAQTEIEQKKYAPALARLTDCLAYFKSVQDHTKTARVEALSAEALTGLGRAAEALLLVRAAKESAGSITDMLLLNHAMEIEARILFDLKNYKKAYEAFVEYHNMKDSLKSAEARGQVEKLQVNLDLKEKVLENSKLKEEQLRQHNELLEREKQILLAEKAQRRAFLILLALGVASLAILSLLIWDRRKILAQGRSLTRRLNKQLDTVSNDLRSHNSLLSKKLQGQVGALSEKIADIDSQLSLQSDVDPLGKLDVLKAAIEMEKELTTSAQDIMTRKEEALRSFNYMVGHDLKVPLNSASNIISLVKSEVGGLARPKALDYLNLLQGLVNEIRAMIDGISAYAQADRLELRLQRIDANALANSTIRQLRQAMPSEMAGTSIEIVSPLPALYADPLLLRQVLANLLSNAVKATRSVAQPKIRITGKMTHGKTALSVEDNGVGIPLQSQRHIFQLFKSAHTRDVFPGTGTGLAIVNRIVERHSGTVIVESEGEGKGTRATLLLQADENKISDEKAIPPTRSYNA